MNLDFTLELEVVHVRSFGGIFFEGKVVRYHSIPIFVLGFFPLFVTPLVNNKHAIMG
jgi:hypothetical protein